MNLRTKLATGALFGLELIAAACGGKAEATPTPAATQFPSTPTYSVSVSAENQSNITDVIIDGSHYRLGGGGLAKSIGFTNTLPYKSLMIVNRVCPGDEHNKVIVTATARINNDVSSNTSTFDHQDSYLIEMNFYTSGLSLASSVHSNILAPELNLTSCE